ncbi:hypothetical protein [Halomarina oriensis]|uniref:Lipoprotein n=1 Tax=Halomarina oriensis TaxID=671145 RepID=A0A6B0GPV5_9EURY|nr:hypothetical protein [Halomarina oriensis]MWG36061.1 hypothetical protein [Halomarina oriensis]
MTAPLPRRSLLAALGTAATATLAGCGTLGSEADSGPEPYRIGGISVGNVDDVPHTLDVLVERDGDVVLWDTYDLPASGSGDGTESSGGEFESVPSSSFGGCTPGVYSISVRLDGTTVQSVEDGGEGVRESNAWRSLVVDDRGALRWGVLVFADDVNDCSTPTPSERVVVAREARTRR